MEGPWAVAAWGTALTCTRASLAVASGELSNFSPNSGSPVAPGFQSSRLGAAGSTDPLVPPEVLSFVLTGIHTCSRHGFAFPAQRLREHRSPGLTEHVIR